MHDRRENCLRPDLPPSQEDRPRSPSRFLGKGKEKDTPVGQLIIAGGEGELSLAGAGSRFSNPTSVSKRSGVEKEQAESSARIGWDEKGNSLEKKVR